MARFQNNYISLCVLFRFFKLENALTRINCRGKIAISWKSLRSILVKTIIRFVVASVAVTLAGIAFLRLGEIALAEHIARADTLPALERAAQLNPENADLHARIATLDPSRDEELNQALALNRNEPSWWIMQSVELEQAGDSNGAENSLRQATRAGNSYAPWWSLTAFYYRQQYAAKFVPAAWHALSVGAGDEQSIFRMAENLKIPSSAVDRQLVPDFQKPLEARINYALKEGNLDSALSAALRLTNVGSPANRNSLLATCEALFLAGRTDSAVMVWNKVVQKHWIQMTLLNPAAGISLNDGGFTYPRLQAGFDWKLTAPSPVEVAPLDQGGIRFELDGNQPENCELLSQYVPLLPGRNYQLKTRFRTIGIPPESGLGWVVSANHKTFTRSPSLSSDAASEQTVSFKSPSEPAPVQLALSYSRRSGTTRIEGKLRIESVSLQLLPDGEVQ